MTCEFRSKAGKTVVIHVYEDHVEVTGDFFTTEEDLEKIEESLKEGKKPENAFILGVDLDELYEKFLECVKK